MCQDGPSDGQLAVGKTLAAQAPAQKHILDNRDAPFRLGSPPLQALEFPRVSALLQFRGRTRANPVVDALVGQADPVAVAVKTTVGGGRLELGAVHLFHPAHAARQQLVVGRGLLLKEFPIEQQALGVFRQEKRVAKLHLGPSLLTHDDVDVWFIQAQDFVGIGHRLFLQNPLARLFPGFGQLLQHLVHPLQHLFCLGPGPVGFRPLLLEQSAVAPGMLAHDAHQSVHLPESLLALPLAVGVVAGMGHLNAQGVDARDKNLRLFHPVFEALVADQAHRFHQGAGGVAQQDPIDRVVDVGLQAGGVQKGAFQIDRRGQTKFLRVGGAQVQKLMDDLAHLGFGPPHVITLEGAFAGDLDAAQFVEAAEVLEQRTVGQPGGKDPVLLAEQLAGKVAAQSAAAVELVVLLSAGRDPFVSGQPAPQIGLQESGFQAALPEQFIDVEEAVAEFTVIDVARNGGQGLRQRRLEGDNLCARHAARVCSNLE